MGQLIAHHPDPFAGAQFNHGGNDGSGGLKVNPMRICSQCKQPLPEQALEGLCPECRKRGAFPLAHNSGASAPSLARTCLSELLVPAVVWLALFFLLPGFSYLYLRIIFWIGLPVTVFIWRYRLASGGIPWSELPSDVRRQWRLRLAWPIVAAIAACVLLTVLLLQLPRLYFGVDSLLAIPGISLWVYCLLASTVFRRAFATGITPKMVADHSTATFAPSALTVMRNLVWVMPVFPAWFCGWFSDAPTPAGFPSFGLIILIPLGFVAFLFLATTETREARQVRLDQAAREAQLIQDFQRGQMTPWPTDWDRVNPLVKAIFLLLGLIPIISIVRFLLWGWNEMRSGNPAPSTPTMIVMALLGLFLLAGAVFLLQTLCARFNPPLPSVVKTISSGTITRVRLWSDSLLAETLAGAIVGGMFPLFVGGGILAQHGTEWQALAVFIVVIALVGSVNLYRWYRIHAGDKDAFLDDTRQTIDLPAMHGRSQRLTLSISQLAGIKVNLEFRRFGRGSRAPYYGVALLPKEPGPTAVIVAEWRDPTKAEAFKDWLSQRLNLPKL